MNKQMVLWLSAGLTLVMVAAFGAAFLSIINRSTPAPAARVEAAPAPLTTTLPAATESPVQAALSADVAAQIALNVAPGASLTKTPELVNFQGTVAYEVLLDQGAVYVDANSGKVLANTAAQNIAGANSTQRGGEGFENRSGGEHEGFGGLIGGHDD